MADITQAQIDALVEANRSALATALASPKPNYKIGNRMVAYGDYIEMLSKNLLTLRKLSAGVPSESIADFDYDITNTGSDQTEYEGDS